MPDLSELRTRLSRPADTMPVRAMALICFAAGILLMFGLLFNPDQLPVSKERRMITIAVLAVAGTAYWFLAPYFRLWMLHLIITVGLISGCWGLSQMNTSVASAMTILSIAWTCLLIGSVFRPPVARAYGVFVFVGMLIAFSRTTMNMAENAVVAVGFGFTLIVTMELLSQTNSRLRDEAIRDPLTGLLNRKGLEEAAAEAMRVAMRNQEPVAVVSLDLDDFKAVNDREGHLAGDRLLAESAAVWRDNIRPQDVLARPGGDEFVMLLPDADLPEAETAIARLASLSPVGFTHGIAIMRPGERIEAKLSEADSELIHRKAELRQPPERTTS